MCIQRIDKHKNDLQLTHQGVQVQVTASGLFTLIELAMISRSPVHPLMVWIQGKELPGCGMAVEGCTPAPAGPLQLFTPGDSPSCPSTLTARRRTLLIWESLRISGTNAHLSNDFSCFGSARAQVQKLSPSHGMLVATNSSVIPRKGP